MIPKTTHTISPDRSVICGTCNHTYTTHVVAETTGANPVCVKPCPVCEEINSRQATIWKYKIGTIYLPQDCEIELPARARFLDIAVQGLDVVAWYMHTCAEPYQKQKLKVLGTGWFYDAPMPKLTHLKTLTINEFVWHFFAETK